MKLIAIATGVLIMTSPADAAPRPAVEHFGKPTLNGQRLPFSERRAGRRHPLSLGRRSGVGADGKLPEGIEAQTKATMDNIGATLKLAGLGYGDVFHCTVFLSRHEELAGVQQGLSDLFPRRPAARPKRVRRERPGARRAARDRMPGLRGEEVGRSLAAYFGIVIGAYSTRVTVSFSPLSLIVSIE